MGEALSTTAASLDEATIDKFIRLDDRLTSTDSLLGKHIITSPVFEFLEKNTVKTIRFSGFTYEQSPTGIELSMEGQSRSYAALALQADILEHSPYFKEPTFTELQLDDQGNVTFSFTAILTDTFVSYAESFRDLPQEASPVTGSETVATSTSTSI